MVTVLTWGGETRDGVFMEQVSPEVVETVYVYFKYDETLIDPTDPRVKILDPTGTLIEVKTLAAQNPLLSKQYVLTRIGTGLYKFSFYSNSLPHGLYSIVFFGTHPTNPTQIGTLTVSGNFQVGFCSREQDLIWRLRDHLEDKDPTLYTLLPPTQHRWDDEHLLIDLQTAMNDINWIPPAAPTNWTVATFPNFALLLEGAMVHTLEGAAVIENWNAMQYTDEYALVISRSQQFHQMARDLAVQFNQKAKDFKYYWALYGDGQGGVEGSGIGIGMGSQNLPFQISRVLSFLPNMKNVFGI